MLTQFLDRHALRHLLAVQIAPVIAGIAEEVDRKLVRGEI